MQLKFPGSRISLILLREKEFQKRAPVHVHAQTSGKSFLSLEGPFLKSFSISKEVNQWTREVAPKYFCNVW